MKRVEKAMNFKNKEGFNPGNLDIVSSGNSTTGQGTYHFVTMNDIHCKMPELRNDMYLL